MRTFVLNDKLTVQDVKAVARKNYSFRLPEEEKSLFNSLHITN